MDSKRTSQRGPLRVPGNRQRVPRAFKNVFFQSWALMKPPESMLEPICTPRELIFNNFGMLIELQNPPTSLSVERDRSSEAIKPLLQPTTYNPLPTTYQPTNIATSLLQPTTYNLQTYHTYQHTNLPTFQHPTFPGLRPRFSIGIPECLNHSLNT